MSTAASDPARERPAVVVITGASAGVGRALARAYGVRRASIGLIARGREGLEATRLEIEQAGGRGLVWPADVADADAIEQAADAIEARFGPIDIWINNAMVSVFSPVQRMTADEFRRVTEVTYLGVVHGTLAALRCMTPRNRGRIVQVGSALAYRGIPLQSAYCAAKHAVQGFCDSLRSELLHDGSRITVTMVQLPALNTPQFDWVKSRLPNRARPVPPVFQPELAADAIIWAAESGRRELYVGMPTVRAILGNKIGAGLLDRYLATIGYRSQQTREPEDPNRPDNLWAAVPGDHGAHGRFDSIARAGSRQLWLSKHRGELAVAALATFAGFVGAWTLNRRGGAPGLERVDESPAVSSL
jgi:NAD(P)-dependent dehydrogenase (short-subunit alcohol dehydrogenase family)